MAEKPDVTHSAEFRSAVEAAVAEAVAKAVPAAIEQASKALPALAGVDGGTKELFSEMALAIAQMSHQGSGRAKPLAPEVIQKREAAGHKLHVLLGEVSENLREAGHHGDEKRRLKWMPQYRLTGKVYLNERLIEPWRRSQVRGEPAVPQDIEWSGPPNEVMAPLNAVAERLVELYRESVGAAPRLKAITGPNGGHVAQDQRPHWMTPGGLVVQGDPPASLGGPNAALGRNDPQHQHQLAAASGPDDPSAPFVHVLGTAHTPARRNALEMGR